jgi:hypothetical protein
MTIGELIKELEKGHPDSPIMVIEDRLGVLAGITHVATCDQADTDCTNIYIG